MLFNLVHYGFKWCNGFWRLRKSFWYSSLVYHNFSFPFNSVFSWNYELCPVQEVDAHLRLYMVTPEVQVWGYLCSSQLNFPAFYAKRDFLRGENSLFTSSALPSLKLFWTGENLNNLYLCSFVLSIKSILWRMHILNMCRRQNHVEQ